MQEEKDFRYVLDTEDIPIEDRDKKLFTHLHLHLTASVSDSMIKPEDIGRRIKALGMSSVAKTDHGNMFQTVPFYKECKKQGIKPIIGMEAYVAPRKNTLKTTLDNANYHLVLLASNYTGYSNLMKISSDASMNGHYYKPRTDKRILRKHSEGIIALSACLGGEVQRALLQDDYEQAKTIALEYDEIFGRGNFFLELQKHGIEGQDLVSTKLREISKETGIPLVVTNDSHYLLAEDYKIHDILMAIQMKKLYDDEGRFRYSSDQFYVKSPEEMHDLFPNDKAALYNTHLIAERCNVELDFESSKLPPFTLPEGYEGTHEDLFSDIIYDGLVKMYGEERANSEEVIDRINYEKETIIRMGYVNYFLITWDFFRFCKTGAFSLGDEEPEGWEEILTGPGRGSAVGSLVSASMGITKPDPLKHDLLFERFLDPSRVSMPDIDSDFDAERRQEVIDFVIEKYGRESVSQIIALSTLRARGAIRAVGKTLGEERGYKYDMVDRIAKMIPQIADITIADALEDSPELKELYDSNKNIKKLIDISSRLEGVVVATSTHAAGVLISDNRGVGHHVPLWLNDDVVVSQYDMRDLEELQLLKMDFLGLSTLTTIKYTVENIKENYGIDIDVDKLFEPEDMKPLEIIGQGLTDGLFQLEGGGMTAFMREMKPSTMPHLIAGIALYRPGPMQSIPDYLEGKRNPDSVRYPFEAIKDILAPTYGVLTYQEQVMRSVVNVAGYDKSDSDSFRKVISKKKVDLLPLHRKWFIDGRKLQDYDEKNELTSYTHAIPGGVALGHDRAGLEHFYDLMEKFGKYAFNESHSEGYAVLAYATAWLRYYYPKEFMAALLSVTMILNKGGKDNEAKASRYIRTCRESIGIQILPPDINESTTKFVSGKDKDGVDYIRYPLLVKNLPRNDAAAIIEEREKNGKYKDFKDLIVRVPNNLGLAAVRGLGAVGTFSSIGMNMASSIASAHYITKRLQVLRGKAKKQGRELNEKDFDKIENHYVSYDDEITDIYKLHLEKMYFGFYLSGSLLDKYVYEKNQYSNFDLEKMSYDVLEDGSIEMQHIVFNRTSVTIVGMFTNIIKTATKKEPRRPMAITEITDVTASCDSIIFPRDYESISGIINSEDVFIIYGEVQIKSHDKPMIIIKDVRPIKKKEVRSLELFFNDPVEAEEFIKTYAMDPRSIGGDPVFINCNNLRMLLRNRYWCNIDVLTTENKKMDNINYKITTTNKY